MSNSRKKYEQKRDKIIAMKNISEKEKSNRLFQNWQDYIFGSIPEHKKQSITTAHFNEMFFVRI